MKVGIFTTFSNFKPEYSLTTVVRQQITMLKKHDYKPVLFVLDIFKDDYSDLEGVEVRKTIPQLLLEPYGSGDLSNLDKDVHKAQKAIEESFSDLDFCFTHDIIFQRSFLPYNIAMRNSLDKLPNIKWLHWMHSGPSFANLDGSPWDNLFTLPKNSRLVYMNYTDQIRAVEMYHTTPANVRTIFNPMDIRDLFEFSDLTRELIDTYDLMSPDILSVYPLSTTRMDSGGKQIRKAIRVMSEIKKRGKTVRFVIINAHANGEREKIAIIETKSFARSLGLEDRELIFTSNHGLEWEHGIPHETVRDLLLLSNVFLFPSYSENCPLVLLEAMAGGNVLVLNQDFPAFKDFGDRNAIYFRFSSIVAPQPDFPHGEEKYYRDVAILTLAELENNTAIKAQTKLRKEFNVDYIFKQQLEPAMLELLNGK